MSQTNYIFIAGPCAAESEQQVLATAQALQSCRIDFFRAGLWKPRTSPHSFQGVGEKGIKWLIKAKEQYGLKICTEVATPEHVMQCRNVGFDALWIGARTVSDPFAVQTLCEYLMGYEGTVLVKNPISDDVDLWQGAIQRLQMVGIKNIIAVHRGVKPSAYHPTEFRNNPTWALPIELRRRMPDMPIITDPSHIAGKADLVQAVAQQAMSLGLDGLMVEVHCDPLHAKSDSAQQLTPAKFADLMQNLNYRHQSQHEQELLQLREQIDNIDNQLWQLIAQRLDVSEQIGKIKQEHDMPIFQPARYEHILQQRITWAKQHNIDQQTVKDIMQILHDASIQKQLQKI